MAKFTVLTSRSAENFSDQVSIGARSESDWLGLITER